MRVLYFVSWGVMNCTFTYATMHTYKLLYFELHSTQDRQCFTYAISNLTSDIWERSQAFAVQCPHTVILLN